MLNTYTLFAGWEVHIVKNCDRGLKMTYLFIKSVCLHNFVTELAYVPSTNHCKKSNERRSE